jgi:polar amino acid transport system substrate-binding protein
MKSKLLASAAGFACSAFACLALLAAAPSHAAGTLDAIKAKKSISIGIPTDFAPYGIMGTDFQPQGVDVDTAKLIAEKLGVKADLVSVSTPNRIPYLQTNKVDLVISALGKTEERAKVIDFSIAYAPFYQGIFGPKALSIKSFVDLADKTIAVTRGTIQDDLLQKVAPPSLKIQRFEDDASTVTAFITQQTQLIATGGAVAAAAIAKNPQANLEYKLLLKDSPCFVGLRKGDTDLLDAVNDILRKAKADGTLEKISQKWLGRGTGDLPE